MEFNQLIRDIRNKIYHPIYLLTGDEEFFIDEISDLIEESVLEESEKEFNQTVIYGIDSDVLTIESMAKRYPMMAAYNVIIVKEAQSLKKIEELVNYAKNPSPTTILVLNHKHKSIDGRSQFSKIVKEKHILFKSKKLYDNEVTAWIEQYVKAQGYNISPKAVAMFKESVGDQLSRVSNELDKVMLNLPSGAVIDDKVVEANVGLSKDYNVFELTNAIGRRDILKANQIAFHFGKNEKNYPLQLVLPTIYRFFSHILLYHANKGKQDRELASLIGINFYFLKDYKLAANNYSIKKVAKIIASLRNADNYSKGIGAAKLSNHEILQELLYDILH